MKQTATMGFNRTGIAASEGRADAMQQGTEEFPPSSHGALDGAGKLRVQYAKESPDIGSVPPPAGVKELAKKAVDKAKGREPTLFMDKLGERLAFERTGTRLYAAVISKHEAYGAFEGGPSRADLIEILEEEHRHFALLQAAMAKSGGDPTAMTPSANLAATASMGVQKIVTDPRTALLQSLEAILIAELTDRDGWDVLVSLARSAGEEELAGQFETARSREEEHLRKIRSWLHAGQGLRRASRAAE